MTLQVVPVASAGLVTSTATPGAHYFVDARSWSATADEWARDVQCQWQTVTGTASTSLTVNGAWGGCGRCDSRWDIIEPLPFILVRKPAANTTPDFPVSAFP